MREERRLRVFEDRVLRRVFGLKRAEVTGEWRKEHNEEINVEWGKLHNEQLNDPYSSPGIVRVIKSRRMRWAGYVARLGERREVYKVLVGKRGGRRPLDPSVDGRIILRWILRKWDVGVWTGSIWLKIGTGGGHLFMR